MHFMHSASKRKTHAFSKKTFRVSRPQLPTYSECCRDFVFVADGENEFECNVRTANEPTSLFSQNRLVP